jgi:(S)-ureidoglycine aminohydrolase
MCREAKFAPDAEQAQEGQMRQNLGETRSVIHSRHALICGDSHEVTTLPNWPGSGITVVISPQVGAKFTAFFAAMPGGAEASLAGARIETFVFVLAGEVSMTVDNAQHDLAVEGYAFVPSGAQATLRAANSAKLIVIEKTYVALDGKPPPEPFTGRVPDLTATGLKGDERVPLQKLLPEDISFDCEVNIMGFQPGASLPYVETHFMEHGLLMLDGGGVYRLDDCWYPVSAGDVIWMGPFCPQWFGAIGRSNARYLIYKNWNRSPMAS